MSLIPIRRHRGVFAAAGMLSLLLIGGVRAQDPNPPETPPAPEGEKLVFKYQPGTMQRFRGQIKGDITLSQGGGAGGGLEIPMTLLWQFVSTEKVVGARQGTGTLSVRLDASNLTVDAGVAKIASKLQNGKFVTTVNGQKPPPGSQYESNLQGLKTLLAPRTVHRNPRGVLQGGEAVGGNAIGGSTMALVQLPDKPVQVGDSWESVENVKIGVPGQPGQGIAPTKANEEIRLTHTLKSIEAKNGKRFAIIESSGSSALESGEGAGPSSNQNVLGTARFDIARGAVVSTQYTVNVNSLGGPSGGRMDANFDLTLNEAPAAPAKPAAKAPAKKRK